MRPSVWHTKIISNSISDRPLAFHYEYLLYSYYTISETLPQVYKVGKCNSEQLQSFLYHSKLEALAWSVIILICICFLVPKVFSSNDFTYAFLLPFYDNNVMSLLYPLRQLDIHEKSQIFPMPHVYWVPVRDNPIGVSQSIWLICVSIATKQYLTIIWTNFQKSFTDVIV